MTAFDFYETWMRAWRWLTKPEHIPVLSAIVALLAAVVGGVTTQLVAGLFKTRGDTRQMRAADVIAQAAAKRWEHEQAFARKQYLIEARRGSYVRFLQRADQFWNQLHTHSRAAEEVKAESVVKLSSIREELHTMVSEILLYNRPIGDKAVEMLYTAPKSAALVDRESFNREIEPWNERYRVLVIMMRESIGIEEDAASAHTQPQSNEAVASGTKKRRFRRAQI